MSVSINGAGNARYDSRTKEYTGSDNGIKRVNQFLDQCRSYLQKADIQKEQKTVDQDYATKLEDAYK